MANSGQFTKGNIPWNKDLKGIHLSPQSEFKKKQTAREKNTNWKGGIQKMKNDCVYLYAGINKRVRRPREIYKKYHGKIPRGFVIIHKDGNPHNDSIRNLKAISRAELLRRNQLLKLKTNKK